MKLHQLILCLVIGVPLTTTGCTDATTLAIEAAGQRAIEGSKEAKDNEAIALKAALCAMSIGAHYRVNTPEERSAIEALCGGPAAAATIRIEDISALRDLLMR